MPTAWRICHAVKCISLRLAIVVHYPTSCCPRVSSRYGHIFQCILYGGGQTYSIFSECFAWLQNASTWRFFCTIFTLHQFFTSSNKIVQLQQKNYGGSQSTLRKRNYFFSFLSIFQTSWKYKSLRVLGIIEKWIFTQFFFSTLNWNFIFPSLISNFIFTENILKHLT